MPLYLTASTSAVIAILYSIYLIELKLKKLWKLTAVMSQIEGCFCYFGACLLACCFFHFMSENVQVYFVGGIIFFIWHCLLTS